MQVQSSYNTNANALAPQGLWLWCISIIIVVKRGETKMLCFAFVSQWIPQWLAQFIALALSLCISFTGLPLVASMSNLLLNNTCCLWLQFVTSLVPCVSGCYVTIAFDQSWLHLMLQCNSGEEFNIGCHWWLPCPMGFWSILVTIGHICWLPCPIDWLLTDLGYMWLPIVAAAHTWQALPAMHALHAEHSGMHFSHGVQCMHSHNILLWQSLHLSISHLVPNQTVHVLVCLGSTFMVWFAWPLCCLYTWNCSSLIPTQAVHGCVWLCTTL